LAEHEQFVEKQLKEGARPERPHLLKAIEHAGRPALEGHVDLREGDFREVLAELSGIDVILTDPPYGVAHLELYVALAKWAPKVLNAGGLLAVMCGEYFLPDVIGALGTGPLPYRWTVAYRVPGNAVRVHPARVATMWKPVLLYGEGRDLGADVVTSDAVEKDLHDWGQSESGMVALVDRLSEPGDHICDPFMGSGTTGWAAVARGRSFTGTDIDPTVVLTARSRVKAKS
jgi:16S rRNA G966 N2-methylase RsmD